MILKKLYIYSLIEERLLKLYKFNEVGLNIILGVKKKDSDEANGVGKTTMVESMRFLLGSSIPKDFKDNTQLISKDIFMVLELQKTDKKFYLGRRINEPQKGYTLYKDEIKFDLNVWSQVKDKQYKEYIHGLFLEKLSQEAIPTFASLREYLIRDEKVGFNDIPLSNRNALKNHSILAFLCGLNNNSEYLISEIKKKQKELNEKLKIIETLSGDVSELKMQEKKIMSEIDKLSNIINTINIKEKLNINEENYKKWKSELTKVREKIFKYEYIKEQYEKNIENLEDKLNKIKALEDIKPFYEQLIGYFPDKIEKNYNEVLEFYNFMVDNRGKYFSDKINKANYDIKKLEERKEILEEQISKESKILKNTDIVSDLNSILQDVNDKNIELAEIKVKINQYSQKKDVVKEVNYLKQKIINLANIKQDEFLAQEDRLKKLSETFDQLVEISYNEGGILEFEFNNKTGIRDTTGRIKINCSIEDESSHGRLYMKINMFDLTWLLNRIEYNLPINFLVHDGSYCKPDNKKIKFKLLNYINNKLKYYEKGQYIITINIDELEEKDITILRDSKLVIAELNREENNKNRFFGFKY